MKIVKRFITLSCIGALVVSGTTFVPDVYAAEEVVSDTDSTEEQLDQNTQLSENAPEAVSIESDKSDVSDISESEQESEAEAAPSEPEEVLESVSDDTEETKESPEIEIADTYQELQDQAPADLDTASSYVVDLSSGDATGSNESVLSIEEAFGVEEQDSEEETVEAIEETELYYVDDSKQDSSSAVVYSPYARHRIIVNTDEELTDVYGATEASYFKLDGGYRLCYESDEATKTAYDSLIEQYGSEAVTLDLAIGLSVEKSSQKEQAKGWGTSYMHLDGISQKINKEGNGKQVVVAILDTGLSAGHEVFQGKSISKQAISLIDGSVADANGHGTAVAGIIAESTSDNIVLMPIKIADKNGESSLDYMLNGLKYASENKAAVANVSLNAYYGDTTLSDERIKDDITSMEAVLQTIEKSGTIICTSAGNDARDIQGVYNYPAMSKHVLAVGAINSAGKKSGFSSYGSDLDFVAPGEGVKCAWIGSNTSWKAVSGTSFACPYVAAACAMIMSTKPNAGLVTMTKELTAISKDLGPSGKDVNYGNGVPVFSVNSNPSGTQAAESDSVLLDGVTMQTRVEGFKGTPLNSSQFKLTWNKLDSVKKYRIYYYTVYNKGAEKTFDVGADAVSKVFNGMGEGHEVYFRIRPLMSDGSWGQLSKQITVQTTQKSMRFVSLKDGLEVKERPNGGKTVTTIPYSELFHRLAYTYGTDGNIWYKIKYKDTVGYVKGASGNLRYYVTTMAAPYQTGSYKSQICVNWKKVYDAEKYEIYRSVSPNGNYFKVATVDASLSSYTDKYIPQGFTYYYKVRALRQINDSWQYGIFSPVKALKTTGTTVRIKTTVSSNMRKGPGASYAAIKVVPKGVTLTVRISRKDSSGIEWYYLTYTTGGKTYTGYVSSKCATKLTTSQTTALSMKVKTTGSVNMRKGAGTSYAAVKVIPSNVTFTVKSSKKDSRGVVWYYVTYTVSGKSYSGYISSKYAKKV